MFDIPCYLENSEWYDKEKDILFDGAPEKAWNDYRREHIKECFYSDRKGKKLVAEYIDRDGRQFVIDDQGKILYEGSVDRNKYPEEWDC